MELLILLGIVVYCFIAGVVGQWYYEEDIGVRKTSYLYSVDDDTHITFLLAMIWPITIPVVIGMKVKEML